jgi:hypothetical protein
MNSVCAGSTWLITTASTLSPLIALFIGFAGTDWLRFGGRSPRDTTRTPAKDDENRR